LFGEGDAVVCAVEDVFVDELEFPFNHFCLEGRCWDEVLRLGCESR
jgi:hypothetical protein